VTLSFYRLGLNVMADAGNFNPDFLEYREF